MNYLKRLGISISISVITFISFSLIITLLSYINVLKGNGIVIATLLIPIISIFIGSFSLGRKSNKKGWLEGIKLGAILIFIIFLIDALIFKSFILKKIIYYSILLITSILGSMIGIVNKKKNIKQKKKF